MGSDQSGVVSVLVKQIFTVREITLRPHFLSKPQANIYSSSKEKWSAGAV